MRWRIVWAWCGCAANGRWPALVGSLGAPPRAGRIPMGARPSSGAPTLPVVVAPRSFPGRVRASREACCGVVVGLVVLGAVVRLDDVVGRRAIVRGARGTRLGARCPRLGLRHCGACPVPRASSTEQQGRRSASASWSRITRWRDAIPPSALPLPWARSATLLPGGSPADTASRRRTASAPRSARLRRHSTPSTPAGSALRHRSRGTHRDGRIVGGR